MARLYLTATRCIPLKVCHDRLYLLLTRSDVANHAYLTSKPDVIYVIIPKGAPDMRGFQALMANDGLLLSWIRLTLLKSPVKQVDVLLKIGLNTLQG